MLKSLKNSGVDITAQTVTQALRHCIQDTSIVGELIHSLSLLPGMVMAIEKNLPQCVLDFATKPLAPEVMAAVPQSVRSCARAFQHLFFCEGDFARAFQAASAHCNVEVDATFVSEELVGFPYHIFLLVQKG